MLTIGEFARLGQVSPRMLRHYDEAGLLLPDRVDDATGYRYYDVAQLGRLHRLVALRDLGFTLEQIRRVLEEDLPVEHLRGMLRMRHAQIEHTLAEDQTRLRRVEAHLHALESKHAMPMQNIVIKTTQPIRLAEAAGHAPGVGPEHVSPVFRPLFLEVAAYLSASGVRRGINIARYGEPADDGSLLMHVGFDIANQNPPGDERIRIVDLPPVHVASVIHQGSMDTIADSFEALIRWTTDSGYHLDGTSRELYHEWHEKDPSRHITELQLPLRLSQPATAPFVQLDQSPTVR